MENNAAEIKLVAGEWSYNLATAIMCAALMALPSQEVTIANMPKSPKSGLTKGAIDRAIFGRTFNRKRK